MSGQPTRRNRSPPRTSGCAGLLHPKVHWHTDHVRGNRKDRPLLRLIRPRIGGSAGTTMSGQPTDATITDDRDECVSGRLPLQFASTPITVAGTDVEKPRARRPSAPAPPHRG
jgi:hypothetical protein